MAKRDLSTMADAEYKLLSPKELMMYNKSLPEVDYENPYNPDEHPYPKVKYTIEEDEKGARNLVSATVESAKQEDKLGKAWKDNPLDFGVETAPKAADIPVQRVSIPLPAREATDAPAR